MKQKTVSRLKLLFAAVLIVAVYLCLGCPVVSLTGLSCPGCGMTRAILSLLKLDFSSALHFHPLVFLLPAVAVLWFFQKKLPKKLQTALAVIIGAVFIALYLFRLFSGSEIVYFDPNRSVLFKIYKTICP